MLGFTDFLGVLQLHDLLSELREDGQAAQSTNLRLCHCRKLQTRAGDEKEGSGGMCVSVTFMDKSL